MVETWILGVNIDSWYRDGLKVYTWTHGTDVDSWYTSRLIVYTWMHGIVLVLLNHTRKKGLIVARMQDFLKLLFCKGILFLFNTNITNRKKNIFISKNILQKAGCTCSEYDIFPKLGHVVTLNQTMPSSSTWLESLLEENNLIGCVSCRTGEPISSLVVVLIFV